MNEFLNKIKNLSAEDLTGLIKLCGGMVVLMLFALYIQNGFALYGNASPAAAIYWQQSTGWGNGTYPSPGYISACVWDNSTAQVAGGEQDPNCYWNPVTAVLDAQTMDGSSGRTAYAQYWCSTQASDHSCSTYTATQGTAMPLLVAASSQVQLDYACQPGQASVVYSASGTKYTYATTTYATSAAGTNFTTSGLSGSVVVTAPASGSTTYKLTCSGGTGGPYTASVMLTAENISISNNALSFGSTPNTVPSGTQATVSWSSSNLKAASCTLAGPTVSTSSPSVAPPTNWTNISGAFNDSTSTLGELGGSALAIGITTDYLISGLINNGGAYSADPNITAVYSAPASNPTGWRDTGGRLPSLEGAQAAVVGNTIYLFGGFDYPTQTYSSAIYSAPVSNPAAWVNTGQHLPIGMHWSQIYNNGTNLYLFGGYASSGAFNTIYTASVSNPLVWTSAGTLPVAIYNPTLVQAGSYLYVPARSYGAAIYRALASNPTSWQSVGTLPANTYPEVSYIDTTNNYMYVYTYNNSTTLYVTYRSPLSANMTTWTAVSTVPAGNLVVGESGTFQLSNGEVYTIPSGGTESTLNPTASTTLWTPAGTVMPSTINPGTLYTVGGQYYAGGTSGTNGMLLTAPVSNPTNWSTVNQTYNTYTFSSCWQPGGPWAGQNVVPENFIYTDGTNLYSSVQTYSCYQPSGNDLSYIIAASSSNPTNWYMLPSTIVQSGYGGLQINNAWYMLGGQVDAAGTNPYLTGSIYKTTSAAPQSWSSAGSLPSANVSFPVVTDAVNNRVYVIGGYTGSGYSSATYSASLNTPTSWSSSGALPIPLESASAGIFPDITGTNRIYVFGGITTGGYASQAIYQSAPLTSSGTLTPWTNVGTLPAAAGGGTLVTSGNTAYLLGAGSISNGTSILTAPLIDTNNGSVVTTPLTQTTTYTLSCLDTQGNTVSTSTTLYVTAAAPTCAITSVTPPSVSGGTATINYTTSNTPTSGSVDNSIGSFTPINPSGALASGPITFTSSPQNITYNMTVTNSAGSGTCGGVPSGSVTIPAACPSNSTGNSAPSCTCTQRGYVYDSGTNTCAASDMCTDIAGNQSTVPAGCLTPTPGPTGSCTDATHVYNSSVNSCNTPPTFTSQLIAAPARVRKGSASTLSWDVTGLTVGTSCSISSFPGGVVNTWNASGTEYKSLSGGWPTAAINQQTIFTLSCTNAAGTTISSATVSLVPTFQEI